MINKVGSSGLPYGYGINKTEKVDVKKEMVYKERELQNEEKRRKLVEQKSFLEMLREGMEASEKEDNVKHIGRRV